MAEHLVKKSTYYIIFGSLMVLTVVTVLVALVDLPYHLNTFVAMFIAVLKASLVVLFFMHVKYSSRLTKIIVLAGFFWLAIMVTFTLSDYASRKYDPRYVSVGGAPTAAPAVHPGSAPLREPVAPSSGSER